MPLQLALKLNSYFVTRIYVHCAYYMFQLLSLTLSSMSPRVRMVPLVSTKLVCIANCAAPSVATPAPSASTWI